MTWLLAFLTETSSSARSPMNGWATASICGRTRRGGHGSGRCQESRYGSDAVVVAVRVDLDGCLDLLNPRWQSLLRDADAQFVLECLAEGRPLPTNRPSGNRARDCATINWFCERATETGLTVRSVRAVFEEGEPIFEASAIRTRSHVQVAVRDLGAVLEVEEISW